MTVHEIQTKYKNANVHTHTHTHTRAISVYLCAVYSVLSILIAHHKFGVCVCLVKAAHKKLLMFQCNSKIRWNKWICCLSFDLSIQCVSQRAKSNWYNQIECAMILPWKINDKLIKWFNIGITFTVGDFSATAMPGINRQSIPMNRFNNKNLVKRRRKQVKKRASTLENCATCCVLVFGLSGSRRVSGFGERFEWMWQNVRYSKVSVTACHFD